MKIKASRQNTPYFFLPPAVDNVISGLPLEEIKFLRDETANLVWAVEKKYRTLYGEPISGYDHYISQSKNVPTPASPDHKDSAKYTLMTSVPWNWIPFIPVHTTELLTSSLLFLRHICT